MLVMRSHVFSYLLPNALSLSFPLSQSQVLMFGNATASDNAPLFMSEELGTPASCVKWYVDDYLQKSDNGRMTEYRHVPFRQNSSTRKWDGDCSSFVSRVIQEGCGMTLFNKIWRDQFHKVATCDVYPRQDKIDKGWFWYSTRKCIRRIRADGFRKAILNKEATTGIKYRDSPVPPKSMFRFKNAKNLKPYDLIGYSIKDDIYGCRTASATSKGDTGHVMFVKEIVEHEEPSLINPTYGRLSVLVVDSSKNGHGKDRRGSSNGYRYSGVGTGVIDIFYKKTSGRVGHIYAIGTKGDNVDPERKLTKNVKCHTYFMARFGSSGRDDESFNDMKFEIE